MAIYGVGAYYSSQHYDTSRDCKKYNFIGTGWDSTTAPDLHEYFRILEPGDIVYIKAAPFGQDPKVKGIGLIVGTELIHGEYGHTKVEIGRKVKWLDEETFRLSSVPGKNNVRSNTIYRETHPQHIITIMNRVESALKNI
ncbi:MAG: hypothetical protein EOO20_11485 [Chryseobacterium sp.]|nr:MAG: hypothetical protein EOO20_11485 [Chryseobacterium sp.]